MICVCLFCFIWACSSDVEVSGRMDSVPEIYPDYKDVTVPSNIAPMNFEVVGDSGRDWILKIEAGDSRYSLRAHGRLFRFGRRMWARMLEEHAGETLTCTLCMKDRSEWLSAEPFSIHISEEETDPFIVYRKIPPGYSLWKEMSIPWFLN